MKSGLALTFFAGAMCSAYVVNGFTVTTTRRSAALKTTTSVLHAGDYEPMDGETKINLKIDLDSPKVATMDDIEKGECVY
jgi:hypothetical protein